jgi:hypothetical protein
MNNHDVAVRMIEEEFKGLGTAIHAATCHGRLTMAIEVSYSLGAISMEEHQFYSAHHRKIIQRQHDELMASMRRSA